MSWRSVLISNPSRLSLSQNSLKIMQENETGVQSANVPLEDISIVILDHPQIALTTQLLSAFAERKVAVFTVNASHIPNGIFVPYLSHSRALKIMQAQLRLTTPIKKRLWKNIIQQKIYNQAIVLKQFHKEKYSRQLQVLAKTVRSGDTDNMESKAAQIYFRALFGKYFFRDKDCFHNSALNYGYAVVRAALARALCAYGLLPAFGLFHHNEQNSFNLADDLIEPYRPLIDVYILTHYSQDLILEKSQLETHDKAKLVSLLHQDIRLNRHIGSDAACSLLAAVDETVVSLSRIIQQGNGKDMLKTGLIMPQLYSSFVELN